MPALSTALVCETRRTRPRGLRWPTTGAIISLALHGAAAASLLTYPEALGGMGQGAATASAGTTVTVVLDSLSEDAPADAAATAMSVAQTLPVPTTAPQAPATAEPVKAEPPEPESPSPDAVLKAAVEQDRPKPEPEPDTPKEQAPREQTFSTPQMAAAASAMATASVDTAAPAPQAAMSASAGNMVRYANKIRSRLAARRPAGIGTRGKVVVTFTIGNGGAVEAIAVAETSGQPRLDRLAVASIRDAAPFPVPPDLANPNQRTFSIPFEFR